MNAALRRLDRVRYKAQHRGLAASLALGVRLFHFILEPRLTPPPLSELAALDKRFARLLAADLANVEAGYYPRELLFQFPLRRYAQQAPTGLLEWPKVVWRRRSGRSDDLPHGIDEATYPAYYRRTFHWQTDGWFSAHSARMYDVGVEFLFLGTADIMRRMVIPPAIDAVRDVARPRVLDVACGTGRMLAQLRSAMPRAAYYGLDLSPFYLREADKTLGPDHDVSLVAENAESMPFADESFDVVTCVFTCHELPRDARRNVVREARRVLRPGGRFIVCDSAQRVDGAGIISHLDAFPRLYHEPYFKGYMKDDLSEVLSECGLTVESVETHMVSKVVVATL